MDQEENKIISETLELSEENNKLLKKLVRSQQLSTVVSVIKWVIVIGASVGVYYLFQPIIDKLNEVYSGLGDIYESAGSLLSN